MKTKALGMITPVRLAELRRGVMRDECMKMEKRYRGPCVRALTAWDRIARRKYEGMISTVREAKQIGKMVDAECSKYLRVDEKNPYAVIRAEQRFDACWHGNGQMTFRVTWLLSGKK